jgi:hypothetical protein
VRSSARFRKALGAGDAGAGWRHADLTRLQDPHDRIEVEVVQADGGRALVVGKLDKVPEAAGGLATWIVVCDAEVRTLPPGV